ncbi:thiamine ABC transporter substrate binding subunit [Arsenophonus symbiont of Ornithomya chloropus]|uniref:thiamine ABC transporter substrate binding subunit n=1 Tax=Arsenophonus symbiont of Ornithomya chloropus TaxID=634121 RepID=UPI0032B1133B
MNNSLLTIIIISCISFQTLAIQKKNILTIYTYNSFITEWGPGPKIKSAFEKQCNCTVKFVGLNNGITLLNRLKIENKNTKADIVLGLDNNLIDIARKSGLFAQHNIDTSKLHLPIKFDDNVFIPYDYGYFAFIYDKNKITKAPKNFGELINSKKQWKIIYQDPRTSTPGLGLLLWIQKIYKDQSVDVWKKIAKKTLTVTKNWSTAYGLFLKGECDFVLSYTSSPAYHLLHDTNDKKNNYTAALFDDGHYLQIEVAAQLANTHNVKLAKKFLQFMLSPIFQKILPTTNWLYPAIDIPLPEVYKKIQIPKKTLQFDAEIINQYRNQWIYLWQNAVSY